VRERGEGGAAGWLGLAQEEGERGRAGDLGQKAERKKGGEKVLLFFSFSNKFSNSF